MQSQNDQHGGLLNMAFSNEVWQSLLHLGKKIFFVKGTVIHHSKYRGIFYIKYGRVCLSYFSSSGKEVKALYYNSNSIFNEARTFSVLDPECTFLCIEDCNLYFFPRDLFNDPRFFAEHPQILQNLLSTMGRKILLHYYALTSLRADTDIVNVSKFILHLYREHGRKLAFRVNYNQQDIADILGVHRTTVARAIKKLREDGILVRASRYEIVINDIELLKKIACVDEDR